MKIAYYSTIPSPPIPGTESVYNDIRILKDYFKGKHLNLYPFKKPHPRFPWQIIGFHRFRDLQKIDRSVDVHHIFSSGIHPFPILRTLRKPVVYTVTAGMYHPKERLKWPGYTMVVGSEKDFTIAKTLGIKDCIFIRPGINCSRIQRNPLLLKDQLILLSASAPWIYSQFHEKGFDLLFEAISRRRNLHLVILMRGVLTDILRDRVKSHDVEDQVTVIDTFVDINTILSQIHGTIVLAENSRVIRPYPHSLIESLAAGKPIIVSNTIPMADYVRENDVGCIVQDHSIESLESAIDRFIEEYATLSFNAEEILGKDFSKEQMIADYLHVYEKILDSSNSE